MVVSSRATAPSNLDKFAAAVYTARHCSGPQGEWMARRRTSTFEDLVGIVSKLPWWVGVALAVVSYLVLHAVASRPTAPASVAPGQLGTAVVSGMAPAFARLLQYVLPVAFGIGAVVSAVGAARQKKLYDTTAARPGVGALNEMSWQDFERLVSEYYRRKGFQVTREGGNGPDGGIDLTLRRRGETYLVQCKQWKAYKVGVQPVREFYGVLAARGAAGGQFVTSGEFTDEAKAFVKGLNVELVDGRRLRAMIDMASKPAVAPAAPTTTTPTPPPAAQQTSPAPTCPRCGAAMRKRVARQGANAGKEFWGCSTYPQCNGTLPLGGP